MIHCFDSSIDDKNLLQTCMLEKNHSGKHDYVPDRFIKIYYGYDGKPTIAISRPLSEDSWL